MRPSPLGNAVGDAVRRWAEAASPRDLPGGVIERDTIYANSHLAGLCRALRPCGPALTPPPVQPRIRVVPHPGPTGNAAYA